MKSIVMHVHEQFEEENVNELFSEVKETVVQPTSEKNENGKTFTAQEMWNQQRQAKSASAMMRRWNLN